VRTILFILFVIFGLTFMARRLQIGPSFPFHPEWQPQFVQNGDFEQSLWNSGQPRGWFSPELSTDPEYVEYIYDQEISRGRGHSVSIRIDEKYSGEPGEAYWLQVLPLHRNHHYYQLQSWVRTKNILESPWLEIIGENESRRIPVMLVNSLSQTQITGTAGWTKISVRFFLPPGINKIRIRACIRLHDNKGGQVWFDDISLKLLGDHRLREV